MKATAAKRTAGSGTPLYWLATRTKMKSICAAMSHLTKVSSKSSPSMPSFCLRDHARMRARNMMPTMTLTAMRPVRASRYSVVRRCSQSCGIWKVSPPTVTGHVFPTVVPVTEMVRLPMTFQKSPLKMSIPPSVTMNACMRPRTMSAPMKPQKSVAMTMAKSMATGSGHGGGGHHAAASGPKVRAMKSWNAASDAVTQPVPLMRTVASPPRSPTPLPAARSMWPGRMTRSIPTASMAVMETSTTSWLSVRAERKGLFS